MFAIVGAMAYFSPSSYHSYSFTSGSPGGNTGSPLDGGATCRNCHGGGSAAPRAGAITTNIPAAGYIPGETYDVNVTLAEPGRTKYGFELVSENASQRRGTFAAPNNQTRTLGGVTAPRITHTSAGTSAPGSTKTWNVRWTAPSSGSGAITFYTALNASNNNGNDDAGDNIYVSSLTVQENTGNSIAEFLKQNKAAIYPNPVSANAELLNTPSNETWTIYNLNGSVVAKGTGNRINSENLAQGAYQLVLEQQNQIIRFVKN